MKYKNLEELREESKTLDKLSGVYLLWNIDELVYVGQSKNGTSRIINHKKDKFFSRYTWIEVPLDLLNDIERFYIKKYKPRYNISNPKFNFHKVSGFFSLFAEEMGKLITPTPVKRRDWGLESSEIRSVDNKRTLVKLDGSVVPLKQRIKNHVDEVAERAIKKARKSKKRNVESKNRRKGTSSRAFKKLNNLR